jgi:hypothetical protein
MIPFGVVSVLTIGASLAFACTVFKGNMTVTGTSSSTGTGNKTGMGYCKNVTPAKAGVTRGTAFSASVAPSSSCAANLGTGTFNVNYKNGSGPPTTTDCMSGASGVTNIGTMSVSSGSGSGSYTIPTSASTGDAQVCVSDSGGINGMQMPVTLA